MRNEKQENDKLTLSVTYWLNYSCSSMGKTPPYLITSPKELSDGSQPVLKRVAKLGSVTLGPPSPAGVGNVCVSLTRSAGPSGCTSDQSFQCSVVSVENHPTAELERNRKFPWDFIPQGSFK